MFESLHKEALDGKELMDSRLVEIKAELKTQNLFAEASDYHVEITRDHMERIQQSHEEL